MEPRKRSARIVSREEEMHRMREQAIVRAEEVFFLFFTDVPYFRVFSKAAVW